MLADITLGQYIPGDSLIHRFDPRVKLIWTIIYCAMVFMSFSYTQYAWILIFLGLIVYNSGIPVRFVVKSVRPLMLIAIFTVMVNLLFAQGDPIFSFGIINITYPGIHAAICMGMRLLLLVAGTSMLTYTTSPKMLADGLEKLLKCFDRFSLPSHEIALMMTIAMRFIPSILEETDKIMKAQRARGVNFTSGGLIKRTKALVPLLVPLFINTFRRADDLAMAMECRCYNGGPNRSRMFELAMKKHDYLGLLAAVPALVITYLLKG